MATNPRNKPTVCASWISPGEVSHGFASSMMSTMMRQVEKSTKLVRAQVNIESGPRIAEARSKIVDGFAETGCNWLWMVDSDMVWEDDALEKLLETADVDDAPIVGGLCFGGRADSRMFPTIYELTDDDGMIGTRVVEDYPKDQVVRVGATGAAFLLVHKRVFVEMKQAFGLLPSGKQNPYPWFVEASNGGRPFGEDISFCIKAHALDIPIHVDTRVKIGHIKTRTLSEMAWFEQEAASSMVRAQATTSSLVLPNLE